MYDATGRKLKKVSPDGITLYHDGIEKAGGGIFVYHAEGRAAFYPGNPSATPPVEDKWYYEFAMRDHPEVNSGQALGNTRITFADLNYDGYPEVNSGQAIQANPGDWIANDPHGSPVGYTEVLQENHYYPFGMNMEGPWRKPDMEAKVNRYQYNGKELNSDVGLGWNDYGARWYDAAVGRWNAVDPLADEEHNLPLTPYHFVSNNPVTNIDPFGLDWYKDKDGNAVWFNSADENYTDSDGNEYSRIGEYYIMEGKDGYLIHRQNEVIAEVSGDQVSEGIAGQGIDGSDLLHAGDFWFSKSELFGAADQNEDVAKWLYNNAPVGLQEEYAGHRRTEAMYDALPAYGAVAAPLILIAGAELAVAGGSFELASSIRTATGGAKQWLRLGNSYSVSGRFSTYGLRWGASARYAKRIGNIALRSLNQRLRGLKLPGSNWRVRDPGHLHFWKK